MGFDDFFSEPPINFDKRSSWALASGLGAAVSYKNEWQSILWYIIINSWRDLPTESSIISSLFFVLAPHSLLITPTSASHPLYID